MNTRAFCDQEGNDHALVSPIVDARDNLGALAVQILASKHDFSEMEYREMIHELVAITAKLHEAYDKEYPNLTF